ncbi:MAG: SDR family oxidoreductase [Candidatus Dadabacteria bacterium]|nr:MAG: SDR family oxidoreductase [Candidatus Dadabacteria bacterium]
MTTGVRVGEQHWNHCLITGGSRGIGFAIARRVARRADKVTLVARDRERLQQAAARLRDETDTEIATVVADLSEFEDVRTVAALLDREAVDVLVCAAGVYTTAPADEANVADWDRMLEINLRAPMHLARAAAASMSQRGTGAIVLLGSVAGRNAFPGNSGYCASKFGLRGFAESLFYDVRDAGIHVCHIAPGMTATDMTRDTPGADPGRMMSPETVAEAVRFAISLPDNANLMNLDLWPQRDVFSG